MVKWLSRMSGVRDGKLRVDVDVVEILDLRGKWGVICGGSQGRSGVCGSGTAPRAWGRVWICTVWRLRLVDGAMSASLGRGTGVAGSTRASWERNPQLRRLLRSPMAGQRTT
ncbi:hypothetical protein L228DRAFT_135878 [Xylona heveae TC161]|uniref:Uncharacterized protein n=1 Tax=Xylona heveae (strain CBS 132557 / TC161) TaxID=1328760 RepID=A0A165GZ49_XYLHT|nr:hypothetical protein L228DRAFT_135878 [Xylona heveae TC161]KZF22783.1 hypothetical protein L228DRAFT_135878 [Xylona heveae TC161]